MLGLAALGLARGSQLRWSEDNELYIDARVYRKESGEHADASMSAHAGENIAEIYTHDAKRAIPDRYIVVLKDHLNDDEAEAHHLWTRSLIDGWDPLRRVAGFLDRIVHTINLKKIRGYVGHFNREMLDKIRRAPEVAYIEQDSIVEANKPFRKVETRSDDKDSGADRITQRTGPWGLSRISHREKMTLFNLQRYTYDSHAGEGVRVFVIDTGINIAHVDFEGRAQWGATIPQGDEDIDANGHGTHCAGTIAGSRWGVSKKAIPIAVKVLGSNGSGSMSDVLKGVEYVVERHLELVAEANQQNTTYKGSVANMSLGGGKSRTLDLVVDAVSISV